MWIIFEELDSDETTVMDNAYFHDKHEALVYLNHNLNDSLQSEQEFGNTDVEEIVLTEINIDVYTCNCTDSTYSLTQLYPRGQ